MTAQVEELWLWHKKFWTFPRPWVEGLATKGHDKRLTGHKGD